MLVNHRSCGVLTGGVLPFSLFSSTHARGEAENTENGTAPCVNIPHTSLTHPCVITTRVPKSQSDATMSSDLPDYSAIEPPAEKDPTEYTHHERRAEILQLAIEAGTPTALSQTQLADRYGVHDSTISRDMDRLRESVGENLGKDAKFTTRTLFQHTVSELLEADDWRATAKAWEIASEWNEWLAELGEQHREPDRIEADVRAANVDYEVVRDSDTDLPTDDDGAVDFERLGFAEGPTGVDVAAVDDVDAVDNGGGGA